MDADIITGGLSKRKKRTAPKSGDVNLKLLANVGSDQDRNQSGSPNDNLGIKRSGEGVLCLKVYAKFLQEMKQSIGLKSPVFPVVALEAAPEGTWQLSDSVARQYFFKKPMLRTTNEVDFDPLFTSDDEDITVSLGRTDDESDPEHSVQKVNEIVGLPVDWRERDQAHSFVRAMIGVGKSTTPVVRN